ncbi:hypothetical protein HYS91_03180 [Candidatus Daviesbacteria bacterium]|nr:hypothetical protein [Candidatus Daviesbacteria bacterium]
MLSKVLLETNGSNSAQNYYAYGLDLISQGPSGSSSRIYPLVDGLGNTRFLTNSSGSKTANFDYDPFGNIRSGSTSGSNYLFQGEQLDPESSLYFLRARYYDPSTGRFITKDPVKGVLSYPQTLSPYAYVGNNPINRSDPSGEAWFLYLLDAAGTTLDVVALQEDLSNCNWGGAALDVVSIGIPFVSIGAIKQVGRVAKVADEVLDTSKQFTKLSEGEIKMLQKGGENIHQIKGKGSSKYDLFKDKDGNIYQKPRDGQGPGEPTGLNIKDF